jgi:RND superfamily putative drug exporter
MASITRWILRHRLVVAAGWIIIAVVSLASTGAATTALSPQFTPPAGYAGIDTNSAILHTYGTDGSASPLVPVVTLPRGTTVATLGIKSQLAASFGAVAAALPGARLISYASTGDRAFVSSDGRTTFALVYPSTQPSAQPGAQAPLVQTIARALATHPVAGAHTYVTGRDALATSTGGGGPSVLTETLIGGLGALLILIVVFGSFLAVVPLLMALVAIPTTFLLVWGLTAVTTVSFIVQFLIALIGLGVSIDYSLLIVTRWREERARGHENDEAVRRAMATAGRAVVFSGTTVGISLLALVVLPVPFLQSIGFGGLLIPLVSVVVACTLLPVLLSTVGPRLDWPRHGHSERPSRLWAAWARGVVRRRWVAAGVAMLFLGALLVPLGSLALGNPSVNALASSGPAYQGVRALETAGIGSGVLDPIVILSTPRDASALARRLAHVSGVRGAVAPATPAWRRAGTALVAALPAADSTSAGGRATLAAGRGAAHAGPLAARVGGPAAGDADFVAAIYGNFPLMVGLIALVTFVLLVRAFRSLLLPLKAILLNVISVGAAWGAMTLVWQLGYGSQAIWGIAATGSLTAWIPLLVFAFLFGLSMDYEVFILARMREEYDRAGSTDGAVVGGIGHTGRLVTSAALILTLTFVSLASSPGTELKIMATGLAAGILLDATVVRMLLVPALVSLFGRWNWWLPAVPARLLRVQPSPLHTGAARVKGGRTVSAAL